MNSNTPYVFTDYKLSVPNKNINATSNSFVAIPTRTKPDFIISMGGIITKSSEKYYIDMEIRGPEIPLIDQPAFKHGTIAFNNKMVYNAKDIFFAIPGEKIQDENGKLTARKFRFVVKPPCELRRYFRRKEFSDYTLHVTFQDCICCTEYPCCVEYYNPSGVCCNTEYCCT